MFSGFSIALFSQTKISGVINQYGHVTGIGTDYVIVSDPTQFLQFKVADTVLLIQMKGASIYFVDLGNGTLEGIYGKPGKHEFLLIDAIDGGTNKITFTSSNIINNFSVAGALQIVKVPSYKNSAVVDIADLTCAPWDSISKTGGVLTLIAGKTLFLNKNIDVSGKGFKGGAVTLGTGVCVGTDPAVLDKFEYNFGYSNSGFKGESTVVRGYQEPGPTYPPVFPDYVKGKGANFTGGGGGNGRFSGGGGGANYGAGGRGGSENFDCIPFPLSWGLGGKQLKLSSLDGGLFMGSGGGSSTYLAGSTPTPGGNGGGIVIIICEEIKGNSNNILANGLTTSPVQASGSTGAGGGGGGGSVALYLQSFSTSLLTISANGGKGGNTANQFGEGGGGGGGLIKISNITIPGNVTRNVNAGLKGTTGGGTTAANGAIGESVTDFIAVLNGFLFNIIRSSVSDNQADSVCSTVLTLPKITGTKPIGGTLPYTYLWEKSYERTFAAPIALANDADPTNYTPTAADVITPTDSVFFRRIIMDSSTPSAIVDKSKFVKFTVHPEIQNNNIIANPDSICFGSDPQIIKQNGTDIIFPNVKSLKYIWQDSTVGGVWGAELAAHTVKEYDPDPVGGFTETTWYRRLVKSGACVDKGPGSIVEIVKLDTIQKNRILNSSPDICYGMTFVDLTGSTVLTTPALSGGGPKYIFKWESNINGSGWADAPGIITGPGYNPTELVQKIPLNEYLFRRVVYSGENNTCVSTSNTVLLKDFPVITGNTITSGNQAICSGSAPANLIGAVPSGGNGFYIYTWQDSSKAQPDWTPIAGATAIDYQPPVLTDSTRYRRVVSSSACSDISKSIIIRVHKPIVNTISLLSSATDTTICSGSDPNRLNGLVATGGTDIAGSYTYEWILSTDNGATWSTIAAAGTVPGYDPPVLNAVGTPVVYSYRRYVSSGACLNNLSPATIKITVLPPLTNTISDNQTVCYNTPPATLVTAILSGGDLTYIYYWEQSTDNGATWGPALPGPNTSASFSPAALTQKTLYRRNVTSGTANCCASVSNIVTADWYALPTGIITSTTPVTICEGAKVPLDITLTGAPGVISWTIVYTDDFSNKVTVPNVTSVNTTLNASPVTGTAHTTFNYSLFSVQDNNGCLATSLTNTRKADVYKMPVAEAGTDPEVVCGPTINLKATASYGSGIWSSSTAVIPASGDTPVLTVTIDSTYAGKNIQHKFIWKETNWQCTSKDSVLVTFDKRPLYTNPAGSDTTLYSFDKIMHLVGKPLQTWESGLWSVDNGTGTFDDASKNNSVVSGLSKGLNTFRWIIKNGSCSLEDIVNVSILDIMIPEGFSPNNDPGNFNNTFIVTGLDLPNQEAELKIVNGAGTEVFSTSTLDGQTWTDWDGKNSKGFDLSEGTYYYLLKLTSKGPDHQVFRKSGFIILKRY